jgi:protease-4
LLLLSTVKPMKYSCQAALLSGLLLTLALPPAFADETTRNFSHLNYLPLPSVALVDDTTALPINPGAAGARDLFEVFASKSIDPTVRGQFSLFGGLPNFSLGYQQFQAGAIGDLRKFYVGYTYPILDFLSVGANYHLTQEVFVQNSNIHSFDIGALVRPARFLSFGFAARNLNAPMLNQGQARRAYAVGVGVRPLGERLTLTADAQWDEGDEARNITGLFGLESEPFDGILLRGSIDLRGQFMFGLGLQFDRMAAGYFHSFNGTSNHDAVHAQITNATFASASQQMGNSFAYVDLSRGIALDNGDAQTPGLFNNNRQVSHWQLLQKLHLVNTLPRYKGVILEVGSLGIGMGAIEEIRTALKTLQQSGKKVMVYLKDAGMSEYYLAAGADQILMHPLGSLRLPGFAYVLPHYRKLLDKVGVEVEFVKVGQYKTGLESFVLEEASAATQEELAAIQQDDFQRYTETLMQHRRLEKATVDKILAKTLFTAVEAKQTGLVDNYLYRDEILETAANLIHQPTADVENLESLRLHDRSWEPNDKIAVIYISGNIIEGSSGQDFLFGEQYVGSLSVMRDIQKAQRDPQVKALVVRINSPGGSPLASDEIFRALQKYKENTKKPVIVSMADVAASGGYWIALAGDKLVANPSTITGSIGIFASKTHFEKLYQQAGVNHTVVKTNERADSSGNHRAFTPEERQILQNNLRDYYRIFLERVSESRKLDIKEVEEVAQGRIYTGKQALDRRLVDQLGGLEDAIALARKMAVLRTEDVDILHYPMAPSLLASATDAISATTNVSESVRGSLTRLFPQGIAVQALSPISGRP